MDTTTTDLELALCNYRTLYRSSLASTRLMERQYHQRAFDAIGGAHEEAKQNTLALFPHLSDLERILDEMSN